MNAISPVYSILRRVLPVAVLLICGDAFSATPIRHYVFFNIDREAIKDEAFLRMRTPARSDWPSAVRTCCRIDVDR